MANLQNGDLKWFATADLKKYEGDYAIIHKQKVVLYGNDLKQLLVQFRQQYPGETPKIAKIPKEELLVL